EISPINHGPYYLIYKIDFAKSPKAPNNPSFSELENIIVPFQRNKEILEEKLSEMVSHALIDEEAKTSFLNRLKTYGEFLDILKDRKRVFQCNSAKRKIHLTSQVSYSFLNEKKPK